MERGKQKNRCRKGQRTRCVEAPRARIHNHYDVFYLHLLHPTFVRLLFSEGYVN